MHELHGILIIAGEEKIKNLFRTTTLFKKFSRPGDREQNFRSLSQAATCHLSTTHDGGFTLSLFIALVITFYSPTCLGRRQQRNLLAFELSCHLPICLPRKMEVHTVSFYCWTSNQRWKPFWSTGTNWVDWPVKPVKTPVKISFLATKRHLSTNRNIHIYLL